MAETVDWSRVTAVLGGAFDPPHRGHRQVVQGLFLNPGIRDVCVVPSATPPDKTPRIPAEARLELTRLNFLEHDSETPIDGPVRVDPRELERARLSGRPSYSFDTLQELKRETPHLAWVIGSDRLGTLPQWHRFPELLGLCHWLVLERKPASQSEAELEPVLRQWQGSGLIRPATGPGSDRRWVLPGGRTFLQVVPTPAQAVSSTQIRESLARTGQEPAGSLLPGVSDQLKRMKLYGTTHQ